MSASPLAVCENHAQREAIGVCVACRVRVCSECSTKIDGINYCVRCLAGLAAARAQPVTKPHASGAGLRYATAIGYSALFAFALWVLLDVILPRG